MFLKNKPPILFSYLSKQDRYIYKKEGILRHKKTKQDFYIKPFPEEFEKEFKLDFWEGLIRKPVDSRYYVWPVDLISLPQLESHRAKHALVFPLRDWSEYEDTSRLLSNDKQAGWDKPWVQCFLSSFLDACCYFGDANYAYHEFSADHLFYRKSSFEALFDFSFSTQETKGLFDAKYVFRNRIVPDFADPYYYSGGRGPLMDLASDYYSIAAILFKLMVGRLPYQGRIMEHEPNSNAQEHGAWMKLYHKNTYFIFDEMDDVNHIGGMAGFFKDELFVERWNGLPAPIRKMFHDVFQRENVLRIADELHFYSPHQWREAIRVVCGGRKE